MQKKIPKQAVAAGIGVMILFIVVFLVISLIKGHVSLTEIESDDDAQKAMEKLIKDIDVSKSDPRKASVTLESNLAEELPEITEYPLSVDGNGQVNIEIFATSEKSGSDKDGWINEIAEQFNNKNYKTTDGKTMSVSIRPMASGMGSDYIISGKYTPDGYTPSNALYGNLITGQGASITVASKRLVGNVAGILLSDSVYDKIKDKYGDVNIETVASATADNVITMGYTNPLSSATGLNFLVSTLASFDSNDILSDKATKGFSDFQANVPYVAFTTLQMRTSAKSGSFNGMIMEYQSYKNDSDLSDNYKFIPFGIRHDNPLYSVGTLSASKQEVMDQFVNFCASDSSQKLATSYGFNQHDDYKGDDDTYSGANLIGAQKLWKNNKDSGKDISAVFVTDISGSMDGEPINALKQSLINGAQYINDNNRIGLVSYSTNVTMEVPIDTFNLNQRAYFQGAVEDLSAAGNTASYDALVVALNMLIEEKKNNPDSKLMLFLLSDGYANVGCNLEDIEGVLKYYQIPVYTISYGDDSDTDTLSKISQINEAASVNATVDDVIYKIKSLFNAQM